MKKKKKLMGLWYGQGQLIPDFWKLPNCPYSNRT